MLVRLVYLLMIKLFGWLALLARSAPPRTPRSWCSGMRSPSCAARLPAPDEVEAALDDPGGQFQRGPLTLTARGTATDDRPAFAVADRNYLSARWPGDAYLFGRLFCDLLQSTAQTAHYQAQHSPGRIRPPAPKHRAAWS
jgi:hypothetical protein